MRILRSKCVKCGKYFYCKLNDTQCSSAWERKECLCNNSACCGNGINDKCSEIFSPSEMEKLVILL